MPYARKSMRKSGGSTSRGATILVKTKTKKVAVARKSRVDKIERAVSKLQISKWGAAQTQRQSYRAADVDLHDQFAPDMLHPCFICNEAICPGAPSYSTTMNAGGEWTHITDGTWVTQPFPLVTFNATNAKYDLQQYRNSKAFGLPGSIAVQPTYLMRGVSYDLRIFARNINCWVEAWIVKPRTVVTRQVNVERQLPQSAPSFINFVAGTQSHLSHACEFYSYERKFRIYVNTTTDPNEHFLGTNNLFYRKIYVGYGKGKVIRATEQVGLNFGDQDIPLKDQSYLMLTTSAPVTSASSHVHITVAKSTFYRDSVGSK